MDYACPNCGANSYEERYSERTLIYAPKLVLDGQYCCHDPNITTTHCTCLKCNHKFDVKEQNGKILETIDCGEELQVPVIDANISVNAGGTVPTIEYVPDETYTHVSIAHIDKEGRPLREKTKIEMDIEILTEKVDKLTQMVESLWKWNTHDAIN